MKYKPQQFDNSDKSISRQHDEIFEAQEFVYGYMRHNGFLTDDHVLLGLDFGDIFAIMADYKFQTTEGAEDKQLNSGE